MRIKETSIFDLEDILTVEHDAFGNENEAELVRNLLSDSNAKPTVSLLAYENDRAIGHALFSKARLVNNQHKVLISFLAPLAVEPEAQEQGIGGKLIEKGIQLLNTMGVDLVFVLGNPDYYQKYGFEPAWMHGFESPCPIPENQKNTWMVHALRPNIIGRVSGKVICSDVLNKPEYWQDMIQNQITD